MEKRFLISRWTESDAPPIPIYDPASVSTARQRVREAGQKSQLPNELIEQAALIASELAYNHLSHSKLGYCGVKVVERQGIKGLEINAADMGPGIERPALAISDERPVAGPSLGAGLGTVLRIADELEFDNRILEGLHVIARKFESPAPGLCCHPSVMGRPYPGEVISGDDAVYFQTESEFIAAVSDGLGHGPEARQASNRAIEVLSRNRHFDLVSIMSALNRELTETRGCAMSVVRFIKQSRTLECVSVGDVHCHLYNLRDATFFTSTPLILGEGNLHKRRIRIESETAESGSILVMFTDGLKSRTTLKGQLHILRQNPIAIAQHLLENNARKDDDALVLVARFLR